VRHRTCTPGAEPRRVRAGVEGVQEWFVFVSLFVFITNTLNVLLIIRTLLGPDDILLKQNLLRIVKLYSVVEIAYVAEVVGQGRQAVDEKYVSLSLLSSCFLFFFFLSLLGF
jgi:hypothetical protein